jgi:hypothetical protein
VEEGGAVQDVLECASIDDDDGKEERERRKKRRERRA